MKHILYFFFLLPTTLFAQDLEELLSYQGRALGNSTEAQLERTKYIIGQVQKLTNSQGVSTSVKILKNRTGISYPVLEILPGSTSELNQEALRVATTMNGLPLVFSPFDLGISRANAFFDPTGKKLGVSYQFILGDLSDTSYRHELYHASTYAQILNKKESIWAGIMKLNSGEYLSAGNTSYYMRFAALDELMATTLSFKLDLEKLIELKRTIGPAEFNQSEPASNLLNESYFSLTVGKELTKQWIDLAQRALSTKSQKGSLALSLGNTSATINTSVFKLDSYVRTYAHGRGTLVSEVGGSEFTLYWAASPTESKIAQRLKEILKQTTKLQKFYQASEKCFYVLIDSPHVAKTNYSCLEQSLNSLNTY